MNGKLKWSILLFFIAFVGAAALLALIPGANVALILANSVPYGPKYGLLTVGGTTSAVALQLGLTTFGMAELVSSLGSWFEWLRWLGVAYLVYLGVTRWRAPALDFTKIAVLSITFITLALLIDGLYAIIAGRARILFAARSRLSNRISGGLLIGAGAALALARNK